MAALTGLSPCATEMSHAGGLQAAEAPLGWILLWAGELQDRCRQHRLSVSLLLLLFLASLDSPCHPLLVAAPTSCAGPCHPMAAPASRHFGMLEVGAGFQGKEDRRLSPG